MCYLLFIIYYYLMLKLVYWQKKSTFLIQISEIDDQIKQIS